MKWKMLLNEEKKVVMWKILFPELSAACLLSVTYFIKMCVVNESKSGTKPKNQFE